MLQCTMEDTHMQRDFTDNITKLTQALTKPFISLAELNVNTMNDWMRNINSLERVQKAKKPEDFFSVQTELFSAAASKMAEYFQKAAGIGLTAFSETNQVLTEIVRDSSSKATDVLRESGMRASDMMRETGTKISEATRKSKERE